MKNRDNYFFCYSPALKEHLIAQGCSSIACGRSIGSNCVFWLFYKDEELKQILDKWNACCN